MSYTRRARKYSGSEASFEIQDDHSKRGKSPTSGMQTPRTSSPERKSSFSRRKSPSSRGGSPPRKRNYDHRGSISTRGGSPQRNDNFNRQGNRGRRDISPSENGSYGRPKSRDGRGISPQRNDDYDRRGTRDYDQPRSRDNSRSRESNVALRGQKNSERDGEYLRAGRPNAPRQLDDIPDPGKRFVFKEIIGKGTCGTVYSATDSESGNKKVAVKVQSLTPDTQPLIVEEYKVYRDFVGHPNLPEFYGIYRRRTLKKNEFDEMWIVMELCEGGTVMDLVRSLAKSEKKLREEHIAYILKETIKALIYLHENRVIHRDVRGHNILMTKEGQVKLADFGLARTVKGEMGKRKTCIGSPCWMAPEVVASKGDPNGGYTARSDVWSIGITAIEMADGKAPFEDIHPTRTLFQIVRNPPPGLHRPVNWSENFNDFITECLEKNPENRPAMVEIIEHPFFTDLPDNEYQLSVDMKSMLMNMNDKGPTLRPPECLVRNGYLKTDRAVPGDVLLSEDLAALEVLTEDTILDELHERLRRGDFQTFVGDVLVILNPNEIQDVYGTTYHEKYNFKCRSDNAPHIYSVADSAYQDVLHNQEAQHVIFAGETNSGKTTHVLHLIKHLMYLGKSLHDIGVRLLKAMDLIHAFSNAATPLNPNSTRCVLQIQLTFGSTGKASGAIFWLYQLEKWRVSTRDKVQSNFHIFYYLYDGLEARGKLRNYHLPSGRRLRYLRIGDKSSGKKRSFKVRSDPQGNSLKFDDMEEALALMEMDDHIEFIRKTLSAILLLGEVKFSQANSGEAEVQNMEIADNIAELLGLDKKKFGWCLTNYCILKHGSAVRRKHTCEDAVEARDVLANTLYQRLVDWLINNINMKISMTRTLFGDKFAISILDLFGFECFSVNRLEQLIVNTMNEQLQCYYNQRLFAWEMQEQEEEEIRSVQFHYYDNREAIDQLMGKNYGFFQMLDHSSKELQDCQYLLERVKQRAKAVHVKATSYTEFTVAHYTGKISYDALDIVEKNRDFVPPEMINTLRQSSKEPITQMFINQLSKTGNVTIVPEHQNAAVKKGPHRIRRGPMLVTQELPKLRNYNTVSKGQYSQTRKMRTCAATFRSTSLEILKNLSTGSRSGGTHFVRCIRADLERVPRGFYREVVRQQVRALALLDTAKARQQGYPYRIHFQEFLRRYKFLAFDYEENVEITQDNCRLLLIRLKMEGWMVGRSKVFLKYYNEEYLARLYETHVRKIVKIQSMIRAVLARKKANLAFKKKKVDIKKLNNKRQDSTNMSQDEAALKIQRVYRGHKVRKEFKGSFDGETKEFVAYYGQKWKAKTLFQVLLRYRSSRYQDLVQFSQQVHLFNQALVASLQEKNERVSLNNVNASVRRNTYVDHKPQQVHKLPFDFNQEFPSLDNPHNKHSSNAKRNHVSGYNSQSDDEIEAWDTPLHRKSNQWGNNNAHSNKRDFGVQTTNSPHHSPRAPMNRGESIIYTPFTRDPSIPVRLPPEEFPTKGKPGPINRIVLPVVNDYVPRSNTNYDLNGSIRSRKKAPPPPIPASMMGSTNSQSRRDAEDWRFEGRMNRSTPNISRMNPINELKSMAKSSNSINNNDFVDEPPFNFQAMLRKTPHQRNSMKRTQVYDSYQPSSLPPSTPSFKKSPAPYPRSKEISSKSSDVHDAGPSQRSDSQRESPEWSPNEMVRMSEEYGREEGAWGGEGTSEQTTSAEVSTFPVSDKIEVVEIAPGFTVKGWVVDL